MSYFCEPENLLPEAFEDKNYYDLLSHHYKLWNTIAFGTTASLLPTSEYGSLYKRKTCKKLRVLRVDLWVDEAAAGSISLHYSQVHRYLRPHLEEAYKH